MIAMTRRDRINVNNRGAASRQSRSGHGTEPSTKHLPAADYDGPLFPDMAE
ncbi:hypothetical protein ACIPY3_19920 [Paenarthrobacter sp. NPDC089714]|uniref:hypothetical protein n=1 Tax=Paenarthrobacter sp. NPDC089714 TaxID=3364377 RepID=UPI0038174087